MAQTWATSAPQCGLGHQQRCSALHTELAETEVGQSLAWCLEYLRQTAKRDSRSHPYFTVVQPATSSLARSKISGFSEPEKKKKAHTSGALGARRLPCSPDSFLFVSLSGEPPPTLASGRGRRARKATEAFIIQNTSKLRNLEA